MPSKEPMTVSELIAVLRKKPKDAFVVVDFGTPDMEMRSDANDINCRHRYVMPGGEDESWRFIVPAGISDYDEEDDVVRIEL